jgi:hypothetical protein
LGSKRAEARQSLKKYVIYLEKDIIDTRHKRREKIKRKYFGSERN